MSDQNILSPDELNALMQSVDSGEVVIEDAPRAPGEVRGYDLNSQDRIIRGRLPTLELVNERFVRQWRNGLSRMLRRQAEITVRGVETIRFNEYINSLQMPSNINLVKVKPLRGTALVVLEPELVYTAVDNYFGGSGKRGTTRTDMREFTATEMRVIQLLLQQSLADLAWAWAPATKLEFEYTSSETNPHFANILTPREHIVVSRFLVELDGGSGEVSVALPWAMLEPIRDILGASIQSDRADRDEKWSRALRSRFLDTEVESLGMLAEIRTSLGRVMRYRAGDIIPIEMPASIPLTINKVPVFRGRFGISNGKNAIRITEIINKPALEREQPAASTP